jgi:ribosomal protein S18 acetylase RimI-like enzyme
MVCYLEPLRINVRCSAVLGDGPSITTAERPDAEWISSFRYRGRPLSPDLVPILTQNQHSVFVTARGDGGPAHAIGRGSITDHWLGITAVEVREPYRRQGLGRRVIAALAEYAAARGVRHVYLQVADDNVPAIALYERLGFGHHHDYVYRRRTDR